MTYWKIHKNGTRTPIQFAYTPDMEPYTPPADLKPDPNAPKIDAYDTPVSGGITYGHITPTSEYPHGGWFEIPRFNGEVD